MFNKLRSFLKEIKSLLAYRPFDPFTCLMIFFETNKGIEKHLSLDIDVEMDKITAQLKENMKNIDTIQRGK